MMQSSLSWESLKSALSFQLFDYERLVNILLFIVSEHKGEDNNFVQRAGICLLNSLACQVDGQQKLLVGNLGAMEKMLGLIRERVSTGAFNRFVQAKLYQGGEVLGSSQFQLLS